MSALPPGPKDARFLLELPRFSGGVLRYFASLSRRFPGPLVLVKAGPGATYLPNRPDVLREMLVQIPERFARRRWWGEMLHLVGEGLLTSDEADWVPQRQRMRPAYARGHAETVAAVTRDEAEAVAARWRVAPGPVDAQEDVKQALLRALVRIMFSPDVAPDERRLLADLDEVIRHVSFRSQFLRQQLTRLGLPTPGEARLRAALARLDAFIADLVDGCRSGRYASGLLLQALLPEAEAGRIDARNLHDEVGTLLLAGFDTTAAAVTFALWELAARPDLQRDVREEAGRDEAPATDAVLQESLRLYPPVWAIHRTAAEPITLGGYRIPQGEHVMACPWAIQRNPAFWPAPEAFRPERFADAASRPGFEYLPFSHGRHTCIGKRMAQQQARVMLGALAEAVDLARAARSLRLVPGVILRAAGGVRLRPAAR